MSDPILLPDGKIRIPVRADDDEIVGDTTRDIGPDDPEFEKWANFLESIIKLGVEGG